jgi:AcrR family transcriptional regulator
MASTATLREPRADPRVVRTRKLIGDALRALLAEKKFESISVQDIARRATVNRATFYAHFPDKFALLDAIVREDVRAQLSVGDPLAHTQTRAMLQTIALNVFDFVGGHGACRIDRNFETQFQKAVETELAAFLTPKFSSCEALLVSSAIVGAAMQWRAGGRREPREQIAGTIVAILSDGLASRGASAAK